MFSRTQALLLFGILAAPARAPVRAAPSPSSDGLGALRPLLGEWSCQSRGGHFTVELAERHARPDQPDSPVEAMAVRLSGAPLAKVGVSTGLLTWDPRDRRFHFDAQGRCAQPPPTDEDDDPDTGVQRCLQVDGSATEATSRWSVRVGYPESRGTLAQVELSRLAKHGLRLTVRAGRGAASVFRCTRTGS